MVNFEEQVKKMWEKDIIRDATLISGVTIFEHVLENTLLSNIKNEYKNLAKIIMNLGSNTVSYYLGKSYSKEKKEGNNTQENKNGQ